MSPLASKENIVKLLDEVEQKIEYFVEVVICRLPIKETQTTTSAIDHPPTTSITAKSPQPLD